jgi:hypothetical protein
VTGGAPQTGDQIGRAYVVLALGVGRLQEGIVDSYYGPPELAEEANALAADAGQLAADAARLREAAAADPDPQRALWLNRQLVALETLARGLAGAELDYVEEVEHCFDARPERTPVEQFDQIHRQLDDLLPPGPSLRERVEARGERLTIPKQKLPEIAEWLVGEIRADSDRYFSAPPGESLSVDLVTDQPWSGYNWYDGDLRSRVEINTDLPVRASGLIGLLTHETFPGHHLEHAWKEQRLARALGRLEATVMLINTPDAYISEGLAEVGGHYVVGEERWDDLFEGICRRAGIALETDEAARQREITTVLNGFRNLSGDAALMLHHEHRPPDEVKAFEMEVGLASPERAEKSIEFISHPLWRTYVFCYGGGEDLLTRWCAAAGPIDAQRARFFRLLSEQLTPSGLSAELR